MLDQRIRVVAGTTTVPLSVVIPARNEEANILAALDSVAWADEKWVVDSDSSDGTARLAEKAGAHIAQFRYSGYGPKKKNWALENLPFRNEWVLLLDADETVSDALKDEICRALSNPRVD